MSTLRIALAQLNLLVGDIHGNAQKHLQKAQEARDKLKADVIIFPELSLTSYPPEDLLLRPAFIQQTQVVLDNLIKQIQGIYCVIGHPYLFENKLYNACSLVYNGAVIARHAKHHLPNYGVFDEQRYFKAAQNSTIATIKDVPVGLLICEDLWFPQPIEEAVKQGARIVFSPNASPFETDKHEKRLAVLSARTKQNQVPIVYVNLIGGQDELVFDGGSMVVNPNGEVCHFVEPFTENLSCVDIDVQAKTCVTVNEFKIPDKLTRIYQALVLAVRDYVEKNHFKEVILGVSGGIDSALTLAIAVDALGADKVKAIFMPSQYSASISWEDAKALADNFGVTIEVLSIESVYANFLQTLAPIFKDKQINITEENIQARARAVLLMALSNKFGSLVLTTGNRSELAVGYCTLYGDMAGGFAVLKDIPKTLVYALANYRNQEKITIPTRTIERPPTAELAPNQKDEDTLPPYAILDQILESYINQSRSIDDIIALGFPADIVKKVVSLIHKNEYKRRQGAIGPRINLKSFGREWRYPITNGFK